MSGPELGQPAAAKSLRGEREAGAGGRPHTSAAREGITVIEVASIALRYWKFLMFLPIVGAALLITVGAASANRYTAVAAFTPAASADNLTALAGVAAQLGLPMPSSASAAESPQFYADLVTMPSVLRDLAETSYETGGQGRATLVTLYDVSGGSYELRLERTVVKLRRKLKVRTDVQTGIVQASFESPWPLVSQAVLRRLLDLLNEFNVERRKSRAAAERRFVASRVAQAEQELRASEEELQRFLVGNRQFRSSPELTFVYERLQRQVSVREAVYTSLVQALDRASIDEVRDTPLITVLEEPRVPARRDSRRLALRALGGFAGGLVLAVIVAFGTEFVLESSERSPDEVRQLRQQGRRFNDQVRALLWRRRPS